MKNDNGGPFSFQVPHMVEVALPVGGHTWSVSLGETILAVQGTVRKADCTPEIVGDLTVDRVKVEGFKEALRSIGIDDAEPKWLLALQLNF